MTSATSKVVDDETTKDDTSKETRAVRDAKRAELAPHHSISSSSSVEATPQQRDNMKSTHAGLNPKSASGEHENDRDPLMTSATSKVVDDETTKEDTSKETRAVRDAKRAELAPHHSISSSSSVEATPQQRDNMKSTHAGLNPKSASAEHENDRDPLMTSATSKEYTTSLQMEKKGVPPASSH